MASETIAGVEGQSHLYSELDSYPWDDDLEFQGGLQAILGSVKDPQQVEHLTLRAKCYYFARKAGTKIDFDDYKAHISRKTQTDEAGNDPSLDMASDLDPMLVTQKEVPLLSTVDTSAVRSPQVPGDNAEANVEQGMGGGLADAPKPASFIEICEMIAEGKPIPGIKDIPDTILEGQSSATKTALRKKPWENHTGEKDQPSWMIR